MQDPMLLTCLSLPFYSETISLYSSYLWFLCLPDWVTGWWRVALFPGECFSKWRLTQTGRLTTQCPQGSSSSRQPRVRCFTHCYLIAASFIQVQVYNTSYMKEIPPICIFFYTWSLKMVTMGFCCCQFCVCLAKYAVSVIQDECPAQFSVHSIMKMVV